MYTSHFGFTSLPFENSPDPGFFFEHGRHGEVLGLMQDFVRTGRGLLVVAGPIGAGKTTLSQMLVREIPPKTQLIWLVEPPANAKDLVMFIAQELGVKYTYETRLFIIRDLVNKLMELHAAGTRTLIIIDEAHLMSPEVLEGVRIMNNFEKGADKLVHIVLIGQEELLETLEDPSMRPLRQRISTIINLGRMDPPMVKAYIQHRLVTAGASPEIMSPLAMDTIAHASNGAPRLVNTLSNIALRNAFKKKLTRVDYEEVFRAAEEIGLGRVALMHLVNLGPEQQVEALQTADLESWAAKIREEVAKEKQHQSISFVEEPSSSSSPRPSRRRSRRGAPRPHPVEAPRGVPWLAPTLLLLVSILTLAASLYVYGPRLGLDVGQHLKEFKELVTLLQK